MALVTHISLSPISGGDTAFSSLLIFLCKGKSGTIIERQEVCQGKVILTYGGEVKWKWGVYIQTLFTHSAQQISQKTLRGESQKKKFPWQKINRKGSRQ